MNTFIRPSSYTTNICLPYTLHQEGLSLLYVRRTEVLFVLLHYCHLSILYIGKVWNSRELLFLCLAALLPPILHAISGRFEIAEHFYSSVLLCYDHPSILVHGHSRGSLNVLTPLQNITQEVPRRIQENHSIVVLVTDENIAQFVGAHPCRVVQLPNPGTSLTSTVLPNHLPRVIEQHHQVISSVTHYDVITYVDGDVTRGPEGFSAMKSQNSFYGSTNFS